MLSRTTASFLFFSCHVLLVALAFVSSPVLHDGRELPRGTHSNPRLVQQASTGFDPLEGTRWRIDIDFGREKGTWMPPQYGAGGERFECYIENVVFEPDRWSSSLSGDSKGESGKSDEEAISFFSKGPLGGRGTETGREGLKQMGKPASPRSIRFEGGYGGNNRALVRGFPRLSVTPGAWQRIGSMREGSLRFFARLPEGLDQGTLQLPAGDNLYFATPAWGDVLSRKGGVVSVKRNVWWRTEYRMVGSWTPVPMEEVEEKQQQLRDQAASKK